MKSLTLCTSILVGASTSPRLRICQDTRSHQSWSNALLYITHCVKRLLLPSILQSTHHRPRNNSNLYQNPSPNHHLERRLWNHHPRLQASHPTLQVLSPNLLVWKQMHQRQAPSLHFRYHIVWSMLLRPKIQFYYTTLSKKLQFVL